MIMRNGLAAEWLKCMTHVGCPTPPSPIWFISFNDSGKKVPKNTSLKTNKYIKNISYKLCAVSILVVLLLLLLLNYLNNILLHCHILCYELWANFQAKFGVLCTQSRLSGSPHEPPCGLHESQIWRL